MKSIPTLLVFSPLVPPFAAYSTAKNRPSIRTARFAAGFGHTASWRISAFPRESFFPLVRKLTEQI